MNLAGKGAIVIFFVLLLPIVTAEWTSNLNEEIRSYYTFNETGNPLIDLVSGLNATGRGNNFQFAQVGVINGSVYGDTGGGLNSIVYLNQTSDGSSEFNIFSDGVYSISIWSNTQNIENSQNIISFRSEATTYINKNSGSQTYIWELNDNSSTGLSVNIPTGTWFHYVITSNLTDRIVYVNGDLKKIGHMGQFP